MAALNDAMSGSEPDSVSFAGFGLPLLVVTILIALWLLPGLLARTAKRIISSYGAAYIKKACTQRAAHFTATSRGFHLQQFTADANSLQLKQGPYEISRLDVAEAELIWPSWQHQRLQLHVKGLQLGLLQRQMPLVPVSAPDLAAGQLEVLEQLLWRGSGSTASSYSKRTSWLRGWLLKAVLGRVELQLQNCCVHYIIPGQLGPAAIGQTTTQQDGVLISVRSISLAPAGTAGHAAENAAVEVADTKPSRPFRTGQFTSGKQHLVSQLDVAGVTVAVVSTQACNRSSAGGSAAEPDSRHGSSPCTGLGAADIAACVSHHSWQQVHVLLRQWQCCVSVHVPENQSGRLRQQAGATDGTNNGPGTSEQRQPAAVAIRYRTAGVAEVDGGTPSVDCAAPGQKQPSASLGRLSVVIEMKSLVVSMPPSAAAITSRLLTRHTQYTLLSPIWSVRPQQPVSASPATWWQHACKVVLAESRRRRPPSSLRLALLRRREYLSLYRALHSQQAGYIHRGRQSKQRDVPALIKALKTAESTMTACEVATHRIFVALVHSQHLQQRPALQQQWLEAMDGLGGFVDLIPGRGQGASYSEPGLAVSLSCPAISIRLTSDPQPFIPELMVEVNSIYITVSGVHGAAATAQQLQLSVRDPSNRQPTQSTHSAVSPQSKLLPVLSLTYAADAETSSPATTAGVPLIAARSADSVTRPSRLGQIYPSSLVAAYLSQLKVRLSALHVQLQPQLAGQVLDYFKAFKESAELGAGSDVKIIPVKQMVLDSFKVHQVSLSFALSALLPMLDISCPQVLVSAPLKHVHSLDGGQDATQAVPDAAVELMLRMKQLHASVGYNSSCYSSLLQQVDVTADVEVLYQQKASSPAAGQQAGHYGVVWMHPDDAIQLQPVWQPKPSASPSRRSFGGATSMSGVQGSNAQQLGGMRSETNRSAMPLTQPYVPVVKLRGLWARLSTHIPTEPAVAGGEHTTAGMSLAGALLWVSPWQVKLLLSTAEQFTADGQALWQRLQHTLRSSEASVLAAAGNAAAATTVQAAIEEAQEIGSAAAAASKAATVVVQTAGVMAPAAVVRNSDVSGSTPSRQQQQQVIAGREALSAKQASRAAASQASISLLCVVPYLEVLSFVDLQQTHCGASREAHRYCIQPAVIAGINSNKSAGQDQRPLPPQSLMQQWSARVAPVASMVLSELRACSSTAADGALQAKAHVSSMLLINLQLLDLCKSPATLPTAAGVYLPAGYSVPAQPLYQHHYPTNQLFGSTGETLTAAVANGPSAPTVSANHNAFVLSTFTPRLTATYQAATLSRWQLLGLSRLVLKNAQAGAAGLGVSGVLSRGQVVRSLLLRRRWQRVLQLRSFARTLDYAMFLLFQQRYMTPTQPRQSMCSEAPAAGSQYEEYQLLYRHCLSGGGVPEDAEAPAHEQGSVALLPSRRGSSSAAGHCAAEVSLQPGSPCNWKSSSFRRRALDRLVVEQLSGSGSAASSTEGPTPLAGLPKQQQQQTHSSRLAEQAAAPTTPGRAMENHSTAASTPARSESYPGSVVGSPRGLSTTHIHKHQDQASASVRGLLSSSAADDANVVPPAAEEPAVPIQGMRPFAALRGLRGGSQGLLQRLWRRKQGRQHAQTAAAAVGRRSRLAARGDPDSRGAGTLQQGGGYQQQDSRWSQRQNQGLHANLQRQWQVSLVDFLDRFTVDYVAVDPAGCSASHSHGCRRNSTGTVGSSPAATPRSVDSGVSGSMIVVSSLLPQLAVVYKQQPGQQQGHCSGGAGVPAASVHEPEDVIDVTLCHLKCSLGPHTVSMLLQLMAGLSAAAAAGQHAALAGNQAARTHTTARQGSGASADVSGSRLRMNFQLVLCHTLLNMERTLLPGQSSMAGSRSGELQTKALSSLLLLDAKSSVLRLHEAKSGSAGSTDSLQQSGMEASCSIAHLGLQDLCACEEQRYVLSGANKPYQAVGIKDNQSGQHGQNQAACSLLLHALLPGPGAHEPAALALSVYNPRLVLVRRFVNDLLYVAALFNHKVSSSSTAGSSVESRPKQTASTGAPAVVLVTLHNLQMVLPRSHACKTLVDKYAEAERMHREADQQRQQQAAEGDQQGRDDAAWSANSTNSTRQGSCGADVELDSSRDRKQGEEDSHHRGPLHAHHPEVVLLQVSSVAVAAPAEPTLLQQIHLDASVGGLHACAASPPLWMRDVGSVKQILANSRAIMSCSGASDHQHQQQPAPAAADGATASTAVPGAELRGDFTADGAAKTQPQPPSSLEEKKHVQFTVGRKQQPAAAVRHGVLLVTEDGASAADLDAQLVPVPSFSIGAAASRLWKRFVARVKPRRSRLIVRPDNAEGFCAATGSAAPVSGAAKSEACASAFAASGQSMGQSPAGQADAAAGTADEGSGALLLVDLCGLELFAGKVLREQDTCRWRSLTSMPFLPQLGLASGGSHKLDRCSLTSLVHMITRTNVQAVVYESDVGSDAAPAATATAPPASPASVIALSAADGLALQLSSSSYRYLMDMLMENLTYRHSTFEAGAIHTTPPPAQHTEFQPNLKFGPKAGQVPSFGLTLSSSTVQGTLWADQRWWTPNAQQPVQDYNDSPFTTATNAQHNNSARPFVSAALQDASLCVQFMRCTNDLHVNLFAEDTEWRDVRMANKDASSAATSFRRRRQLVGRRTEYEVAHNTLRRTGNLERFEQARQQAAARSSTEGDSDTAALTSGSFAASAGLRCSSSGDDEHYSGSNGLVLCGFPPAGPVDDLEAAAAEEPLSPQAQGFRSRSLGRLPGLGPASTRPINLYSRLDRLTPKPESADDDDSVHGMSSEETVGEQQLDVSELYPSLLQPSAEGLEEVPDLSLIRTLAELPADESAHLPNKGKRANSSSGTAPSANSGFKFHMGYLKESTMTVEVTLGSTLIQWPYLSDMSLVSAIINIFYSDWGAAPKLPPAWLQLKRNAWLYFNLVITDSQIFMPLITPHMNLGSSSGPTAQSGSFPSPYSVLRDVVMKQASLTGEDIECGRGQPLQQEGLALTFGAFRFGYFYGGDGEAMMRFDVRNMAGFVRDPSAVITNWMLPLPSAKLEMRYDFPLVEEHKALQPLLMISRRMLLYHAIRKRERRRRQREARAAAGLPSDASSELQAADLKQQELQAQDRQDNASGSYTTSAARSAAAAAATPEQRLLALACEHAEEMFGERVTADWHNTWAKSHGHSQPVQTSMGLFGQSSSGMFGVYKRKARSELVITIAPVTLRAAFSNINTWKTLQADMEFAGRSFQAGLGMWPPRPDIQAEVLSVRAGGGVWPPPPTGWAAEFRRSSMRCSIELTSLTLMLCDDKPHSFGAPDVLQAMAHGVSFVHAIEYRYPRTAPERADRLHLEGGVGMSILNNSNSKWEVLLEPWPLLLSLSDPINPLSKADRTLYGQALSSEPLRVNFHPSSLLSIGDLLAFIREVSAAPASSIQQAPALQLAHSVATPLLEEAPSMQAADRHAKPTAAGATTFLLPGPQQRVKLQQPVRGLNHTEAPPSIEQQMALGEGVTSRIPQRYLIQNLTGSHLHYWSPADEAARGMRGAQRRVLLPAHSMHELKVTPALCKMQHLAADGSLVSSGFANAICIQLAGSWLPLESVAVDVVGKYRYEVRDPLGSACLPLMLDVLLVGRTKMLRLHSCIWLENNTGMKLEPCLQLGHGCTTPVVLGAGDKLDSLQRLHLRALKPKEGRFLPAAAALGGLLFLAPEGHMPAAHDVLRLDVSLKALSQQQGYITCQSKPGGIQHGPLHLAATVRQGLQNDPYFTTQNLTEVPRPGTLRKARVALEASIHISPTLQLANGLPYDVLGWALVPPVKSVSRMPDSSSSSPSSKAAEVAEQLRQRLSHHDKQQPTATDSREGDGTRHFSASNVRESPSGGTSVAQGAALAAGIGRSSSAGLQQVLAAGDRRKAAVALGLAVASAGSPMQILQHLSLVDASTAASPSTPVAPAAKVRRSSWFGGTSGPGIVSEHNTDGLAAQRRRPSGVVSPTPHASLIHGQSAAGSHAWEDSLAPAQSVHQAQKLQLSQACELLLLQRLCRDMLLEEFLTTLHLVLSPAMATRVDVAALLLLDLPSLVALALGVLAEEFGWIAKSFPQAFSLILKVETAMGSANSTGGTSSSSSDPTGSKTLQAHQLPWAADQLPIAELFALLQWLQQSVARLQLAPGGTADLYLDPQLEVYAALRVPVLAMQSRPTLVTGGLGNHALTGSDSLWLSYTTKLDAGLTQQQPDSDSNGPSMAITEPSFAGQPRLGLSALQALGRKETMHQEVIIRMTDVARQLAELASRWKINPLNVRSASHHGANSGLISSEGADLPILGIPASVLAAGSAVSGDWTGLNRQKLLQPWSSAPGGLPVSYPAASGSQIAQAGQQLTPPAPQCTSDAELLPWFAVVVELLGDIVRLSAHEAEMLLQDSSADAARVGRQRRRFCPEQLLDDLELADTAMAVLGDSLHLQALQAAGSAQPAKDSSSQPKPANGQLHVSRSSNQLADEHTGAAGHADSISGIAVNVPATMVSVCDVLLTPPADVDRIFTQFNLNKGHVLSDDEMQSLLKFSCQALIDHIVTTTPAAASECPGQLSSPRAARTAVSPLSVAAAAGSGSSRRPKVAASTTDSEVSVLHSPRSSSSMSFSPQPAYSSPSGAFKQHSRLQQPNWQDNVMYCSSPTESAELTSGPPTPALLAPPSTPAAAQKQAPGFGGVFEDRARQQQHELQAESGSSPSAAISSSTAGAAEYHGATSSGMHTSLPGAHTGSTAPEKGFRSLRSLWPSTVRHAVPGSAPGRLSVSATVSRGGLFPSRRPTGSSSDESEGSDEEGNPLSPRVRGSWPGSFRRMPGASVRHLARAMGRATGAPVRLVHGQLSDQLRAALDRKMRSTPPHLLPPGSVSGRLSSPLNSTAAGPGSGILRHHGHQWLTMTLQALGRGAVAAEVHEGRPGFCAPHSLKLSLISTGGSLAYGQNSKVPGSGSRKRSSSDSNSATRHILLTASFWLDNRSGLNLVLSDLDRRILKGIPGPRLQNTADVHSPGLPRDGAALEASEPDLSALLASSSSHDNLLEAAAEVGESGSCPAGSQTAEASVEMALSRLQEVRPALLNEQSWLRFWVEEHVVLPPGSKATKAKSRRTFSFSKAPASLVSALSSPGAAGLSVGPQSGGASSSAPVDATSGATASGQVQAVRSQPSSFFKIAVTGHKTDIQVKGKKTLAQIWDRPEASQSVTGVLNTSSTSSSGPRAQSCQQLLGRAALVAFAAADSNDDAAEGQTAPLHLWDPAVPLEVPVQRLYEFAVEVWPTPAEGPFRATKVVSIKSKYILFNDTGMVLEYKQKGTPDLNHPGYKSYGEGRRFAGLLQPQERVSFHWDNIAEPRLLLVRPAAPGWPWSGAFPLIEKEDYIGLRLRNRCNEAAVIIPVNTTVGRSGSVLVTFKSTNSVPPLRIENRTKSVTIMLRQQVDAARTSGTTGTISAALLPAALPSRKESSPRSTVDIPAGWTWDSLAPGSSIPFAWDDVTGRETVVVAAGALGPGGAQRPDKLLSAGKHNTFILDLDSIQKKPHVMLVRPVNRPRPGRNSAAPAAGQTAAELSAGPLAAARAVSLTRGGASAARSSPSITHQQQQLFRPALSVRVGSHAMAPAYSSQPHKDARSSSREHAVHEPAAGLQSTGASAVSNNLEPKVAGRVKGTVFDKKMYVSLYADGPTRVLCFSDTPIAGSDADEEGGSQQLMSRLHQVARQLLQLDRQLAAYLGSSYAMRAARGSRAVPAMLLMQQQQQQGRSSGPDAQVPAALQGTGGWCVSGTAGAAVALLQQMGLHPTALLSQSQAPPATVEGGTAAPLAARPGAQQGRSEIPAGQVPGGEAAAVEPAHSRITQSHISSRAAVGAAAAAAAGISITDGILSVDGTDGGLRLYYDKLTLMLDSGLPLGGNCKVKLLSARDLVPAGADRFYGFQAMMAVSGRRPVLSSLAAAVRDQQDVVWEHEELFAEVTAVSELTVEVWGIPYTSVFGRRGQATTSTSRGQAPGESTNKRYLRSQSGLPANSVCLGAVQIPLVHTLPGTSNGGKEPHWYSLLRLRGDQQVSGQLQVSIAWSFTRETLLASELSVLERLLDARQEVLALLRPLSSTRVARMMGSLPAGSSYAAAEGGRPADKSAISVIGPHALTATESRSQGAHALQEDADGSVISDQAYGEPRTILSAGSDSLEGLSGDQQQLSVRRSIVSSPNVFAGLDLGLADSSVVTLELDVAEVAHLSPRSGWSQDLTHALLNAAGAGNNRAGSTSASLMLSEMVKSSDLPLPVVYVFCGTGQPSDEGIEVASGIHTLNPSFARSRHQFKNVGLRSVVRVLVYDRRSALDSRLLGAARLPAASIPAGSGPLYMWLPLSPPPSKSRHKLARLHGYMPGAMHGKDAANHFSFSGAAASPPMMQPPAGVNAAAYDQQQLQVLLRVRVVKPATHNTTASLQANLAGLLLNAKTPGGDELLNLTVDTMQCAMLTTTRERQLSVSVRSVQLDNQLLETRQPVVLSPATQGEELVGYNLPKDKHKITLTTDKTLDDMESPARAMFKAVAKDSGGGLQPAAGGKQLQVTASGSSVSAAARKVPLIRVSLCQTLTKPINGAERDDSVTEGQQPSITAGAAAGMSSHAAPAASTSYGSTNSSAAGGGSSIRGNSSAAGGTQSKSAVSKAAIMSFRKVELLMGALDLKTDQAFLEAVFMFIQSMPLADLWQDAAWQQHIALLQGATTAGDSANSEQTQQQPIPAALVGRRTTITAVPQHTSGAAGNGARQQLTAAAAAAAARLHGQQSPQQQHLAAAHPGVAHGRSRSVGSVPAGWDLQISLQQSVTDIAAGAGAALAGPPSAAAAAAVARAARKAAAARRAALNSIVVLAWLPGKHDQELNSMKGQSSTWYFLEKLYVSALCMNVTIALTSSIRTATAAGQTAGQGSFPAVGAGTRDGLSKALGPGAMLSEVQRTVVKGMVTRLSGGDNGLQLINVSDVALRLSSFKLDNRLLNQVGLSSELYRHYFWAALAELRKVLGGAGPGLVQLPASIIWAGFSVVDLLLELQQGRRKPLHSAFALMHVVFTLFSQLSGVATRFVVSMYALVPVQRHGTLSDHSALQRYVRMPATAGEAFYQAVLELYLGTAAGVLGLFLDPAAGMRLPGALGVAGALVGLMKGAGGLMVRPAMGVLDASSKCLKGIGLLFLGKRGIQGKLVRRVRPPGASEGPAGLAGSALPAGPLGQLGAPGRGLDDATLHYALVASWQARLPALSAELEGDEVVGVMATRSCRLLLLTRRHVLYLRASAATRSQQAGSFSYTIRWLLPCSRVDHVRGEEERLKIVLEYHSQLRVPQLSVWRQRRATAAAAAAAAAERKGKKAPGSGAAADGTAATPAAATGAQPAAAAVGHQDGHVFLRIPLQRSLRCASPELYQLVIRAISRHLVQMMAAPEAAASALRLGPPAHPATELSMGPVSRQTATGRGAVPLLPAGNLDLYNVP